MFMRHALSIFFAGLALAASAIAAEPPISAPPPVLDVDLLVVGGGEAGVSAAIQAARLGVKRIVLVNDIDWLGGQFSAEGVGAIDEWTTYRGKRTEFARSGMFAEMVELIRRYNAQTHGLARPGNGFCAAETIEPAAAAKLFEEWIAPYAERGTGQIQIRRHYYPLRVMTSERRVTGVEFAPTRDDRSNLRITARQTIDASDWGDVIRLSGAKWSAGPDLKARFGEPNAPAGPLGDDQNEMNPISYCLVLRAAKSAAPIPPPAGYDERTFFGTSAVTAAEFKMVSWPPKSQQMNVSPFVDTAYPEGIYSPHVNIYAHRRLVDARHNRTLAPESETILVNWPTQDYPLYDFPSVVAEALEKTEPGASRKNVVAMTREQRQIVFDDAKRHALGMLHHLQTTVAERTKDQPVTFRLMELAADFGTPDRLPPKPYIREGLRLESLYMLREGDIRMRAAEPGWARHMPGDSVFGFQFNIDFHPTRRVFLGDDKSGPWVNVHTENRNWSTHTDRACFALRSLVPVEMDGLVGTSKNIGVSSIVSSAVRLHGQMMLCGQAAGVVAAECLAQGCEPRDIARSPARVRRVQRALVGGYPGVLLWPYQDLSPGDVWFEAANLLAVEGIYRVEDDVDFSPWKTVTRQEGATAIARAYRWQQAADLARADAWLAEVQEPAGEATWKFLHDGIQALGFNPSRALLAKGTSPLARGELARHLWAAIRDREGWSPDSDKLLAPGNDFDGDGIADLDDALPLDRDNNNLPDRLESPAGG
ncbi:MAG: FAD-dependent oxidoreductase [Pirellulaceae bacterium]|nr:FAD-dependent oxidoreductase [Pirellulaceae bacterium]